MIHNDSNRLFISESLFQTRKSSIERDKHTAFLWACKALEKIGTDHALTESEMKYLHEAIMNYKPQDK